MKHQINVSFDKIVAFGDGDFLTGWRAMSKWSRENLDEEIHRRFMTDSKEVHCFFESETDAMAFKIVWT